MVGSHASKQDVQPELERVCARQSQRLYDSTIAINRRAGISEGDAHVNAGDTISLAGQEAVAQIQARLTARARRRYR